MPPPIVAKSYRGRSQGEAAAAFQRDASMASADGYRPISQSWASGGSNGSTALAILGLICLVGGVFLFIPLLVVGLVFLVIAVLLPETPGELSVTYQRPDRSDPSVPSAPVAHHMSALEQLTAMRDRGLITPEDFEAKKAELLGRM